MATLSVCATGAAQDVPAGEAVAYPPCTKEPSAADTQGAKGAHSAAKQFFDRGDYDRAIRYWNDAYEFDCSKPPLLLNLANAYEKKGDRIATVTILEAYLERAPDSPEAETVRTKVENLKAQLGDAPPPPPPPPDERSEQPDEPPPPKADPERPFGIVPWIVAGGGAAVAIGGLFPLIIGQGLISDAESACPERVNCDADVTSDGNTGNDLRFVGSLLVPVGAAALVGGLVWQFVWNQPEEPAASGTGLNIQIVPQVDPGGNGGVIVRGTF